MKPTIACPAVSMLAALPQEAIAWRDDGQKAVALVAQFLLDQDVRWRNAPASSSGGAAMARNPAEGPRTAMRRSLCGDALMSTAE
jgi:hypothetical protein